MTADLPKFDFVPMPWIGEAACRGMDPNFFQPDIGQPATEAKQICNGRKATRRTTGLPPCPVRTECLNHAVAMNERGIWGGTTERERRAIRAKEPRSKRGDARVRRIVHGTVDGYRHEERLGLPPCKACREAWNDYKHAERRRGVGVSGYDIKLREFVTLVTVVHRGEQPDLEVIAAESRDIVFAESVGSEHGEEADV
jgi:WhiB family redox-sensing transcriptional regulator